MRMSLIWRIIKAEVYVICRSEAEADNTNQGLDNSPNSIEGKITRTWLVNEEGIFP